MITETNVTLYRCDHCNKPYRIAGVCKNHETKCNSNPANFMMCADCIHCEKTQKKVDNYEGGYTFSTSFKCSVRNIGLYPPKVVHKGLLAKYPATFEGEILMPKMGECNKYKPDWMC